MTEYLTLGDLLGMAERLGLKVRDVGLLDSAAHRPTTVAFGVEVYPAIAEKAAALLHSIVQNHALFDGNKRLGWTACEVFLLINGYSSRLTDDEAFDLVLDVTTGRASEVDDIADRLQAHPEP